MNPFVNEDISLTAKEMPLLKTILPLRPSQGRILILHGKNTYLGGIKRGVQFFRESSGKEKVWVIFDTTLRTAGSIAGTTAIGAAVGSGVGSLVGTFAQPGLGTMGGALMGAKIGAIVGASLGTAAAPAAFIYFISTSEIYMDWKKQAINDKVYPIFQDFIKSQALEDYVCPITHELPTVPVEAPCHHFFEKAAIEDWLKRRKEIAESHSKKEAAGYHSKKEEVRCCPLSCEVEFTINDLKYSQKRLNKIISVAKALFWKYGDVLEQNEANQKSEATHSLVVPKETSKEQVIVSGLDALIKNGKENSRELFLAASTKILEAVLDQDSAKGEDLGRAVVELYKQFEPALSKT